jgi:hypothetical protein
MKHLIQLAPLLGRLGLMSASVPHLNNQEQEVVNVYKNKHEIIC